MSTGQPWERPDPPRAVRVLPLELFVKEGTWLHWKGSPTQIERLASRVQKQISSRFISFDDPRYWDARKAWDEMSPHVEYPQRFVFHTRTVATQQFWVGSVAGDELGDEIEAQRFVVSQIEVESSVIERLWPIDVFERVPLRPVPPPAPLPPGVHVASEADATPQRIELQFQASFPAVRLRVIAAGPMACTNLFDAMARHVAAGARPRVWDPSTASALGAIVGAIIGDGLFFANVLREWTLLFQAVLGAIGWFAGSGLVRWTFPPLELVEAWERSRRQRVQTRAWQAITLVLALASVILAVALTQPSCCRTH